MELSVEKCMYQYCHEPFSGGGWVNRKKEGQLFDFKYGKLYKTVVAIDKDWFPHRFRGELLS